MAVEDSSRGAPDGGPPKPVVDEPHLPTAQDWSQQLAPQPPPNLPATTQSAPQSARASRDVPFPAPTAPVQVPTTAPPIAGQTKQADEMFCQSCGRAIKKQAALCVYCGVPV